jgi:hypothetical protein
MLLYRFIGTEYPACILAKWAALHIMANRGYFSGRCASGWHYRNAMPKAVCSGGVGCPIDKMRRRFTKAAA